MPEDYPRRIFIATVTGFIIALIVMALFITSISVFAPDILKTVSDATPDTTISSKL